MGYTPEEVGAMSLWQFNACQDGWIRANSAGDADVPPPSDEQHDYLLAKYA